MHGVASDEHKHAPDIRVSTSTSCLMVCTELVGSCSDFGTLRFNPNIRVSSSSTPSFEFESQELTELAMLAPCDAVAIG